MINVKEKVHYYYWEKDINCAKTMLNCLSENYHITIQSQVINAAIGLAGAGQFRAQCGLVEGALMFIGIYSIENDISEQKARNICYEYARQFQKKFGSLRCYDLRPTGFVENNPPHMCEKITCEAVEFAIDFMENQFK